MPPRMEPGMSGAQVFPTVTVGFPTYNREWSLPRVLTSLLALDYDKKRLRICFVDNESTDKTLSIIKDFKESHGSEYESVTVDVLHSNIPQARNLLFKKAEGTEYIFFLDSDITVPPDTVKRLVSCFGLDPKVGIAALPWDDKNSRKRAGPFFDAIPAPSGPHFAYKVGNGCDLVSMEVVDKVGYFNPKLRVHEDSEFCYRVRKAGFKIVSDSSSQGTHLRDITVNAHFYFNLMRDSARTYRELLARGSVLHYAKVTSSLLLVLSFLYLIVVRDWAGFGAFAVVLVFSAWLNTSPQALDDGARVKPLYRPVIGLIFTVATLIISALILLTPLDHRQ